MGPSPALIAPPAQSRSSGSPNLAVDTLRLGPADVLRRAVFVLRLARKLRRFGKGTACRAPTAGAAVRWDRGITGSREADFEGAGGRGVGVVGWGVFGNASEAVLLQAG